MEILGIDEARQAKRDDRTWDGVKAFFNQKIPELKETRNRCCKQDNEKDLLYSAVLDEVLDTLERQLSQMSFFTTEDMASEKLKYAPLTNSGCESEFAKLDNKLKVSGGTTPLETLSRKNIVSTNSLLVDPSFTELSTEEKKAQWKWGRTSNQVHEVKQLQRQFMETIRSNKLLALEKKKQLKRDTAAKTLNLLEKCKIHGGPATLNSLTTLGHLSEGQLLTEISFLRHTTAPDIKQKRRIKVDGKYKMQKFTCAELIQNIKNAVHPTDEAGDMKELVMNALRK